MPNTYVTVADVQAKLGPILNQLLGIASAATPDDEPALVASLLTVNDLIDNHLRGTYTLPLASVPPSLVAIGVSLVRWELISQRPEIVGPNDESLRSQAQGYLDRISSGRTRLDITAAQQTAGTGPASPTTVALGSLNEKGFDLECPWIDRI
jgi:phage gp36-like protein